MNRTLKDRALQAHYDAMFVAFATEGWAELMKLAADIEAGLNNIRAVHDQRDLYNRQGQLHNLAWLQGLRDAYEAAYAQMLEDDEMAEAVQAADESLFDRPGKAEVIE